MSTSTNTRRSSYRHAILAVMAVVVFAGCDRANNREDLTPTERAFATGTARVSKSHDAAFEESEEQEVYTVIARHNPGRCGAPNFEVFVRGAWTRAAIITRDQSLGVRLVNFEERARGRVDATLVITGAFDSRPVRATNGVEWPAFELEEILEVNVGSAARARPIEHSLACAFQPASGVGSSRSTP